LSPLFACANNGDKRRRIVNKIVATLVLIFACFCLANTENYIKINNENYSKTGYISLDLVNKNNKIEFINLGFIKPELSSKCKTLIKIESINKETIVFSFNTKERENCVFFLQEKKLKITLNLSIFYFSNSFKNCELTPLFSLGPVSVNHIKKYYPEINFLSQDPISISTIGNYYEFAKKVTNLTYYYDGFLSPIFFYGKFADYKYPIGFINTKYISRKIPNIIDKSMTLGIVHPSGFFSKRDLSSGNFYFVPHSFRKGIFFTNSENESCVEFQVFSSGKR
jgi:hypothetical protein